MNNRHILYLSHGGGPLPLLQDPGHTELVATLQRIAAELPRPDAILVISAHWENDVATVTAGAQPRLIYDYSGFPPESYAIEYPCPGAPALAQQVHRALTEHGVTARLDAGRGFDHGLFVPLKLMYPEADIPCVQLSLLHSLDAADHLAMGRALRHVAWDNLLVIGSGFSFHNMRAFHQADFNNADVKNAAFDAWLNAVVSDGTISEAVREQQLLNWDGAAHARFCHPREEHLLPLHVCYAAAGKRCDASFKLNILKKKASMFYWSVEGD